jgi:hypothetical protein
VTPREFVARMEAAAPDLTSPQLLIAARFVENRGAQGAAAKQAMARLARREMERAWEEEQLHGAEAARRGREPA